MKIRITKELLLLKVLMFLWWGDYSVLIPMLLVHMNQIGLSVTQSTAILTFMPIFMIASQPLLGMLADKTRSYKLMSIGLLVTYAVCSTYLFFIPTSTPAGNLQPRTENASQCGMKDNGYNISLRPDSYLPCGISNAGVGSAQDLSNVDETMMTENQASGNGNSTFLQTTDLSHNQTNILNENAASNMTAEIQANALTFPLYFVFRILTDVTSQPVFVLMESSALVLGGQHDAPFGRQLLWGTIGFGLLPVISSHLADAFPTVPGQINFVPVYIMSNVIVLIVIILSLNLNIKLVSPAKNMLRDLRVLASSCRNVVFLIVQLYLGTFWGFSEVFILLYMKTLDSPAYLMGLTFTVSTVCGIPALFMADRIIAKVGHVPLLIFCFVVYTVRFVGYSLVHHPALCLIFEAMELFTYHLYWVAAVTYAAILRPPELVSTVQGTLATVHYAVGMGVGSLIGGQLIDRVGYRVTYQIMAGFSLLGGILYTLFYIWDKRKTTRTSSISL